MSREGYAEINIRINNTKNKETRERKQNKESLATKIKERK